MEVMFLRNVGWHSTDYTAVIPDNGALHNHRCENLESYTGSLFDVAAASMSDYITSNSRMTDEQWLERDLEVAGRGLIEVPSRKFRSGTGENHENCSQDNVSRSGFEPITHRILHNVTSQKTAVSRMELCQDRSDVTDVETSVSTTRGLLIQNIRFVEYARDTQGCFFIN
jgi:hypothetical protein